MPQSRGGVSTAAKQPALRLPLSLQPPSPIMVLREVAGLRGARQGGPARSCPIPPQTLGLRVLEASSQATSKTLS